MLEVAFETSDMRVANSRLKHKFKGNPMSFVSTERDAVRTSKPIAASVRNTGMRRYGDSYEIRDATFDLPEGKLLAILRRPVAQDNAFASNLWFGEPASRKFFINGVTNNL